jgi:acid phosphatase type 7
MNASAGGGPYYRPRRSLAEALAGATDVVGLTADRPSFSAPPQPEQPLPAPTGEPPFRLDLADVVGTEATDAIASRGSMTFHTVGDSGGVKSPEPQEIVTMWMEHDFDTVDPPPSFFYHLGDVVYFTGARSSYYDQFYDPYLHYAAPIFAIPGNHDGDLDIPPPPVGNSLDGFMTNFCSPTPTVTPDAKDAPRPAMTQPNCYWTLLTPLATFVGLYTNCPEGGVVHQDQADWFQGELAAAPADKALVVALHHPPYSGDSHHSSSIQMRTLLEQAFSASGRTPDIVLTGHVHNYQRWSVPGEGDSSLTYIVAGAGGYPNLHTMAHVDGQPPPLGWQDPQSGATLESYNFAHRHGFLRLTVTPTEISGVYTTVPRPQESWSDGPVTAIDNFSIPLALGAGQAQP